jgi:hypothetical protein
MYSLVCCPELHVWMFFEGCKASEREINMN